MGVAIPKPIQPIPPVCLPFQVFGLDFIGPLQTTKLGNTYATRWVIAKPFKRMDSDTIAEFLHEEVLQQFGSPLEIDRGKAFLVDGLAKFIQHSGIHHVKTTPYHPQNNGVLGS